MAFAWLPRRRPGSPPSRIRRALRPMLAGGPEALEPRALMAQLPPGFVDVAVTDGLANPTALAVAPDGRVFVTEQQGRVRVIQDGVLQAQPLLTVTTASAGEQGLQSIALDPNFAANGHVYLYYAAPGAETRNRVERWTVVGGEARPETAVRLLELDPLPHSLHNGGALHFGPDGMLYVAVGDGYAAPVKAQSLDNFFGKMLRIRPDGTIPDDNPFVGQTTGAYRAIWALGLRNPFSFAIDPGSGQMLINDVGQDRWEEVNVGRAGANYGWPFAEGASTDRKYTAPRFAYPHQPEGTDRWGCAVTGGTFYNAPEGAIGAFPAEYRGKYFFEDYCTSDLWTLDPATGAVTTFGSDLAGGDIPSSRIDLDVAADGSLYYLVRGQGGYATDGDTSGTLRKVAYVPTVREPRFVNPPRDQQVGVSQPAVFSAGVIGEGPFAFQWQRNGRDIRGATGPTYTLPRVQQADSGARFRLVVANAHGRLASPEATLTVLNARPPRVTLTVPGRRANAIARAGEVIQATASAFGSGNRRLPDSSFAWRVDLHHDQHFHPFLPTTTGSRSLRFTIPGDLHEQGQLWYRITLTATDPSGLSTTVFRDIRLT